VTGLLPTKFFLPPIPAEFVARPQLLEKLDEAFSHRLTLVSAPAGAGKTTLVSAWVKTAQKTGAIFGWLSLDEADIDPGRFLEYLVACLEEGGLVMNTTMPFPESGEKAQVTGILVNLIQGLVNFQREVILILDDYHLIQGKEVNAALEFLLNHAPPRLHLVLLTRSDPPFQLARLRASGQLVELRMDLLRFSTQEAAAFLKIATGVRLAESDVVALNERTEGWVSGLQMAAISLRGSTDASTFVEAFTGSHRFVFDYLVEQVLSRQTVEIQEFLLYTSVLERLSAPLCDAVAGTGGAAQDLLDTLERDNLFLTPLDDERSWYIYHRLFADLLKQVLEHTHPGMSEVLHRRACNWYAEHGWVTEALHHALAADDMEMVARLVSSNVLALVEYAELTPILLQIDAVPRERRTTLPWLQVAYAWGLAYAGKMGRASAALRQVEILMGDLPKEESARMMGHVAAVRAYAAWMDGNQPEAIALAEEAAHWLPSNEIAIRSLNLTTLGNALNQYEADPRSTPVLEQAMVLARQAGQSHVFMLAATAMAYACVILGRFHRAFEVCQEALELAEVYQQSKARKLTAAASSYAMLSRVWLEWGEIQEATKFAVKGLALSEMWGQSDTIMVCLLYLAYAQAMGNDTESALQVLQRARNIAQNISPWHTWNVDFVELEIYLDTGLLDAAESHLETLRQKPGEPQVHVATLARLLVKRNRPSEALSLLEHALPEAVQHPTYDTARLYAYQALAYFQNKNIPFALDSLKQALDITEPENRISTFLREGEMMERLLQIALPKQLHPGFIRRLLAAFMSRGKLKSFPVAETLIEPLSEREMEVLQHLNGPLSTPEIAVQLIVSVNTVRTHTKNIYSKLGVHGRSAAVRRARELSLIK
jgi:LuxR family transcriptional regulator, maltose regulon positive regulatory protein